MVGNDPETKVTPMSQYKKAIWAFFSSLIGGLALVITGHEGFADVTVAEWLVVAGQVVAVVGGVYGFRNDYGVGPE